MGDVREGFSPFPTFPNTHPGKKCDRKDDYIVVCPDLIESILLLVFWKGNKAGRNGTEILYGINRSENVSALQRR